MINEEEKRSEYRRIKLIKAQLSKKCQECGFLEVTNIEQQKVYCPYMIKECVLSGTKQ